MQQRRITALVVGVALLAMLGAPSLAQAENLMATLAGTSEAPVCSTTGEGTFQATVNADETSIAYTLTYDLDAALVQQAHIHLAQVRVSGGISVWLCQTPGFVPPPTVPAAPTCSASPNTVTGTLTSANVIGPTSQGLAAGEFAELLGAMRKGLTYANVHSTRCPTGEVRQHYALDPGWLDPLEHQAAATQQTYDYLVHDAMIKPMPEGLHTYGLAEHAEMTADFTKAAFRLRPGLKFHDGQPLTTADVQWTYEQYTGVNFKIFRDKLNRIERVDDRTIIFHC